MLCHRHQIERRQQDQQSTAEHPVTLVASDARASGDEELAALADAALAGPAEGSTMSHAETVLALRTRLAPNAVASPITPIVPSPKSAASKPL